MPVVKRKTKPNIKKTPAVKKETPVLELPVFDQQGQEVSREKLSKEIFGLSLNSDLVHQVAVSQSANWRVVIAHTKGRGEVRGGGKKPWRQKGTGRARVGSIRSPLWRGGGVTFGPTKDRVYKRAIPKKMRRKALLMVLSAKVRNNLLVLLDELKLEKPKTKAMFGILAKLPSKKGSTLLALPSMDKKVILAARNLAGVKTLQARDLNVLDLLDFKYLVMPMTSIKVIKETFSNK